MIHNAAPPGFADRPRVGLTLFGQVDLCRGLFAALVVLCHGFTAAWGMDPNAPRTISPATYDWLLDSVGAGFYWVMGFFVLSGFCIHRSVERQLGPDPFPIGQYLVARASRILPLYYLAFAFAVACEAIGSRLATGSSDAFDDPDILVAQLFVVQNLVKCYPGFVASWSITNEFIYYLFYGALACLAARRPGWPARVGIALSVGVGGALQVVYLLGYRDAWVLRAGLLFGLGLNWFLGALVAAERDRIKRSRALQVAARAWPVVLASAIVGYHLGLPIQASYLVSGAGFTLLMIRMSASSRADRAVTEPRWATRAVGFLGLMSYPTYLFHAPFQALLIVTLPRLGWQADWRVTWALMAGSSLALGVALAWLVERPIMRWRSGLLAHLRSRPTLGPVVPSLAVPSIGRTVGR